MATIRQARPAATANIRAPLFILGVALALVAFLVMFAFGLLFAGRTASGAQTRVVVASAAIDARTVITPDMLTVTSFPASAVPPGAFSKMPDLAGDTALVSIPKGQVISANLVVSSPDQIGSTDSFLPIPPGWIAVTIPTNELEGVAGYITQGDYINVLATVNTQLFSKVNPRQVTATVFLNVHVIRVGPSSTVPRTAGQAQGVSSSITVVVTLCDAQYLDWLSVNGTLKYVLLNKDDYNKQPEQQRVAACPATQAPGVVGPAQVQARWNFLAG